MKEGGENRGEGAGYGETIIEAESPPTHVDHASEVDPRALLFLFLGHDETEDLYHADGYEKQRLDHEPASEPADDASGTGEYDAEAHRQHRKGVDNRAEDRREICSAHDLVILHEERHLRIGEVGRWVFARLRCRGGAQRDL